MMGFLAEHFSVVVFFLLVLLGLVLGEKQLAWKRWISETLFFAWAEAERQGILHGWEGREKLDYYLTIVHEQYRKREHKEIPDNLVSYAFEQAEELSIKDKVIRFSEPSFSPSKQENGAT